MFNFIPLISEYSSPSYQQSSVTLIRDKPIKFFLIGSTIPSVSKYMCSGGKQLFTLSNKTWIVQKIMFKMKITFRVKLPI